MEQISCFCQSINCSMALSLDISSVFSIVLDCGIFPLLHQMLVLEYLDFHVSNVMIQIVGVNKKIRKCEYFYG